MKYSLKNSQQSLTNILYPQNNPKYISGNNQNINYLLNNFKIKEIISHNNNCYISKFKTTKNSPERLILEKNVNPQKKIENNISKKITKLPIKSKMIIGTQKKSMEELLKKKSS